MRTYRPILAIAAVALAAILVSAPAVAAPPAADTTACSTAVRDRVSVLSPTYGSELAASRSAVTVRLCAPGMRNLDARSWHAPDAAHPDKTGYDRLVANVQPDASGFATFTFPASQFPRGPIVLRMSAWNSPPGDPSFSKTDTAYLQLYNRAGASWNEGAPSAVPAAAAGKRLVHLQDFRTPITISRTGIGADYASRKPDTASGSEFGDGIFGDDNGVIDPFTQLDSQYLRIRATKNPAGYTDPAGWGRQYTTGNLASARTDGTGTAFSLGYFEARILFPAGAGAWGSFWTMSLNSLPAGRGLASTAEVDIVEQYGHDPAHVCQAQHWWLGKPETHATNCSTGFTRGDVANTWHVYGVNITSTDTIYYLDGSEVWRQPTSDQAKTPMYYYLTLGLGGGWPVDLSRSGNQIDMYVDYVRVYA